MTCERAREAGVLVLVIELVLALVLVLTPILVLYKLVDKSGHFSTDATLSQRCTRKNPHVLA